MSATEKKSLLDCKIVGVPAVPFLITAAVLFVAMFTGNLGDDLLSTIAFTFALGGILYEIGDRIPVFNRWIGGGSMLAMMGASYMVYKNWIPEETVTAVTNFYDGISFQTMFICFLMAGSLLLIDRDTLIKSIVRYIPTLLAGVAVAGVFGVLVGKLMGHSVAELLSLYVLPIMGGGNGAGAVPLSQIYEEVTGNSKDAYYAKAIAILTFANVLCVIVGALLNGIGNKFPSLTGDKKTLMRHANKEAVQDKDVEIPKATVSDCAQCFLYVGAIFACACVLKKIGPSIAGAKIHQYAWFVLLLTVLNFFDLIPLNIRSACKTVSNMFSNAWCGVVFASIGIAMTDFAEFISVINLDTLIISLAVVFGAVVGTWVVGYFFGFYPIDSAVTAGLCMANRGGGGDVVVLGAADRMDLMSYAAISSRIGGALVLIIASIIFSILY